MEDRRQHAGKQLPLSPRTQPNLTHVQITHSITSYHHTIPVAVVEGNTTLVGQKYFELGPVDAFGLRKALQKLVDL